MSAKVIQIKSMNLKELTKHLIFLKKQEQLMSNPLLKDWFAIRNQIRALERQVRKLS